MRRLTMALALIALTLIPSTTNACCLLARLWSHRPRLARCYSPCATYRTCAPAVQYAPTPQVSPQVPSKIIPGTSYVPAPVGLFAMINHIRVQRGLRQLQHDANLAAWAASNNAAQLSRGLGHHVMAGASQVAGVGSETMVVNMWLASPAHAAIILNPNASIIGVAASGSAFTANLR